MMLTETYRPHTWSAVVGQNKALRQIEILRKRGLAGRAYWITGQSGTGKTTIARLLAAEVADPFCTVEIDASELTAATIADIERSCRLYGFGSKPGRAFIVNEAHGLRAPIVRRLLVMLEAIPAHCVWIFTTTVDGMTLFEDAQVDAHPLLSRCAVLALSRQGLAQPFAVRAREIAEREGLNGKLLPAYVRLLQVNHNNMRAALQAIESGEMVT